MRGLGKKSGARRTQILGAALRRFTHQGYDSTTLQQVRAESGASIGSIYHHFKSKEELAGALYVEGLRDYHRGFLRTLEKAKRAADAVKSVVRYHLAWVEKNRDWARYLLEMGRAESVRAVREEIRSLNRSFFPVVVNHLRGYAQRGEIRNLPPDVYSSIVIGPAQDYSRHWLAGRCRTSISKARGVLAEAAWNAVRV